MNQELKPPEKLLPEHLEFLKDLRNSGAINMIGAAPYLRDAFPDVNRAESHEIVSHWMKTFKG